MYALKISAVCRKAVEHIYCSIVSGNAENVCIFISHVHAIRAVAITFFSFAPTCTTLSVLLDWYFCSDALGEGRRYDSNTFAL